MKRYELTVWINGKELQKTETALAIVKALGLKKGDVAVINGVQFNKK
jgi:hypothetical protein